MPRGTAYGGFLTFIWDNMKGTKALILDKKIWDLFHGMFLHLTHAQTLLVETPQSCAQCRLTKPYNASPPPIKMLQWILKVLKCKHKQSLKNNLQRVQFIKINLFTSDLLLLNFKKQDGKINYFIFNLKTL